MDALISDKINLPVRDAGHYSYSAFAIYLRRVNWIGWNIAY